MVSKDYDEILIGSGSGKKVIEESLRRDPGKRVAVIEKDEQGGICLNRGCRPTKMLLSTADTVRVVEGASNFGIDASITGKDFPAVMERMRRNQEAARSEIQDNFFDRPNVDYYHGLVRFQGPRSIRVEGDVELAGERFFLCAGSEPMIPPIMGLEETPYLTSRGALNLKEMPESLAIIGGGYIAAEMGYFFSAIGTDVTIFGRNNQFIPGEEPEVSHVVQTRLGSHLDLNLGYEVIRAVELESGLIEVIAENGGSREEKVRQVERVIVATGRLPVNERMSPEKAGVELDERGWIKVDEQLRTTQDHIWAMGDCIGGYLFKHVADYEAEIVAQNAVYRNDKKPNYQAVPHAVFTEPEVSAVGLSEDEAVKRYGAEDVFIGFARFEDTVKGQAIGARGCFVKVIATGDGQILGAHIVGPHSSILIHELALAMAWNVNVDDLAAAIFVHPSLSKVVKKACDRVVLLKEYREELEDCLPGFKF